MGAKAICMKNTLEEKRAAVYWVQRKSAEHRRSIVGAGLLAKAVDQPTSPLMTDRFREQART
jgi:hypothetical protein